MARTPSGRKREFRKYLAGFRFINPNPARSALSPFELRREWLGYFAWALHPHDQLERYGYWLQRLELEAGQRVEAEFAAPPRAAAIPTVAVPGSQGKVEILRQRVERGEQLHHPSDRRDDIDLFAFSRLAEGGDESQALYLDQGRAPGSKWRASRRWVRRGINFRNREEE